MNRLKAWFHSVVTAEVRKVLDFVMAEYQKVMESHILSVFTAERKRLSDEAVIAKAEMERVFAEMHSNAVLRLAKEMRTNMDAELKAFEARVQHTLEATIKEAPAHWRADEQAIAADIELRTPKR